MSAGRWAAERPGLLRNPEFLRGWLAGVEALPQYNGVRDDGTIAMLRRLVVEGPRADE